MIHCPFMNSIYTCILSFTVRPTDYGPHHTMYPKVVIISDGLFNDCSPDLEGKQPCPKVRVVFCMLTDFKNHMKICIITTCFKITDRRVADICLRGHGCHGYKNAYLLCPSRKKTGCGLLNFLFLTMKNKICNLSSMTWL